MYKVHRAHPPKDKLEQKRERWHNILTMVKMLHDFFETNSIVMYFIYGQVFFVIGLTISLRARRYSRLEFYEVLPPLAVSALAYGISQWGNAFIPIQRSYVSYRVLNALWFVQVSLLGVSFFSLLRFSLKLNSKLIPSRRISDRLPVVLFFIWEATLVTSWFMKLAGDEALLLYWEIFLRYTVALPAAMLAAYGLDRIANVYVKVPQMRPLYGYIRLSEFALVGYGILGGGVVPEACFFPANVLNNTLFEQSIGVPVYVFRAVCGFMLAFSIIHASEKFQERTEQIIEESHDAGLLLRDRERISRELHDNTIQAIYAAGLTVQSAHYAVDNSPREAKSMLEEVMQGLDSIIQDLRRYIFDLRTDYEVNTSLSTGLNHLLEDLRINTLLNVDMSVDGEDADMLSAEEKAHIMRIVREAFINIAKHAQARNVAVRLQWGADEMKLRIADDGIGVDVEKLERDGGHGLRNMRERAVLLGGSLEISSHKERGFVLDLDVPYK